MYKYEATYTPHEPQKENTFKIYPLYYSPSGCKYERMTRHDTNGEQREPQSAEQQKRIKQVSFLHRSFLFSPGFACAGLHHPPTHLLAK